MLRLICENQLIGFFDPGSLKIYLKKFAFRVIKSVVN
jgi:hypothetical protein